MLHVPPMDASTQLDLCSYSYDFQSGIEPILPPMDASMQLDLCSYDLQSIIEPVLHPTDASTQLDSRSMIYNQFLNLFYIPWMLVC